MEFIDFSGVPDGIPPMLVIGNQRVHLGQIISVADGPMIIGHHIGFYSGDNFVPDGRISEVRIAGDDAYLVIDGAEFAIDRINFITEALRLRNSNPPIEVTHEGVRGTVGQVFVNAGAVWIRINSGGELGNPIRFADFMGANLDGE